MAVKIRLRRVGAKKQPAYRIVVADSRAPRDGRFIEILGHYNPLSEPSTVVIDAERALHWLRAGAQPTDVLLKMLEKQGIWAVYKGLATEVIAPVIEAAPVAEAAPVVDVPVIEAAPVVEDVAAVAEVAEVAEVPASDDQAE